MDSDAQVFDLHAASAKPEVRHRANIDLWQLRQIAESHAAIASPCPSSGKAPRRPEGIEGDCAESWAKENPQTRAKCLKSLEAWVGIEPAYAALQAAA